MEGFSFGAPAAGAAAPTTTAQTLGAPATSFPSVFSFGTTTISTDPSQQGFGGIKVPAATTSSSILTSGSSTFNFLAQPASTAATAPSPAPAVSATSLPSGFSFGTPTNAPNTSQPSGFGGFGGLAPKPAVTTTTTLTSGSLFTIPAAATATSTPATTGAASTTPAASLSAGFSFSAPAASSAPSTQPACGGFAIAKPAATTLTPGSSSLTFPSTAPTTQPSIAILSTATTTSSSLGSSVIGAPNLSMRQLEERLNKWLVELKEQEERFIRQAAHVNAWDQVLQNGHDQVQTLKDTLHTVKSDQSRLEAELDFIRGQQEELERLLDPLESAVISTPVTQLNQGDRQRDNMYHLAQNLDGQLRQMTDDLGKVIEHLNSNSSTSQPNDPVTLVARILSAHMDTLKWVDQNTTLLSQKMDDVARITSDSGKRG